MPFNVPSLNYPLNYSMKCPIKQITVISILFSAFCGLHKSAGSIKEALSHEGILSNRSYLENGFMFLSCVSSLFSVPVCYLLETPVAGKYLPPLLPIPAVVKSQR